MRLVRIAILGMLPVALNAHAQQVPKPGARTAAVMRLQMPVVLRGPTLVLMIARDTMLPPDASPDDREWRRTFDSTLAEARRVADSSGYQLQVRYGPTLRVIDPKGNATYQSPRDALDGYVIVAPSSSPRVIPGALSATELLRALRDYGRLIHPLQT
ncbi:MAG TPA: hypothetical protein VGV12_04750 [Gemmatimonadales bacterium]|nr:hypothetical protein [Gemmatimonadales bacterium]